MRYIFLLMGIALLGCRKEIPTPPKDRIEDGILVYKRPLWHKTTTDGPTHTSGVRVRHTHNDGFLAIRQENGLDYLTLLDAYTGDELWKWRDLIGHDSRMGIKWAHVYRNYFVFHEGTRTYCIDLDTGETNWSIIRDQNYHSYVSGYKESYFLRGYFDFQINGKPFVGAHRGDVRNTDVEQWIYPKFDSTGKNPRAIGGISGMQGFERNGEEFVAMSFGEANENWIVRSYCALYNVTREEWVYDRQELDAPPHSRNSVDGLPIVVEDRVYFAMGHHIVCHDLWTGEQIWRFDANGNFVFGGFNVEDGRVYAQSEADALWCLDALTGEVVWKGPDMGTTSKMVTLNGVLYISEGAYLYALDMETGEVYWKLESPDDDCCGEKFKREINVLPGKDGEKGLVLTSTYLSAVAYEAVR